METISTLLFSIKQLQNLKDNDFKEALHIYQRNTPLEIETRREEIEKFIKTKRKNASRDMYYFSLCYNDHIIGYSQVAYLKNSKVIFIDYFTISSEYKSNITFFPLFNLIIKFFNDNFDYTYFLIETAFNQDERDLDEDSKFLNDFLPLVGFQTINLPYVQPTLGENQQSNIPSRLLIKSKFGTTTINIKTYNEIINDILINHYLDWYDVIYDNEEEKRNSYHKHIDEIHTKLINKNIKEIPFIKPQCSNCSYFSDSNINIKIPKKSKGKKIISYALLAIGGISLIVGIILYLIYGGAETFYYMFSPVIAFIACTISFLIKNK